MGDPIPQEQPHSRANQNGEVMLATKEFLFIAAMAHCEVEQQEWHGGNAALIRERRRQKPKRTKHHIPRRDAKQEQQERNPVTKDIVAEKP